MLVWGTSSIKLKQQVAVKGACNACGHEEFVLHGIQRYGHIWWIPFLPLEKLFFLTCLNCHSTISNVDAEKLAKDADLPGEFKAPFLSYVGWFIVLGLIGLIVSIGLIGIQSEKRDAKTANYITKSSQESVKTHDLLILHDKTDFGYVLARVLKINENNLIVQFSKMLYMNKGELVRKAQAGKEIFDDSFYEEAYHELTLDKLKEVLHLEMIIVRKDNPKFNSLESKERV